MANKDNQSQRFIYIRSLKEKVPCTEQQFQEFYREATRIRKKEQYYHRCKCPMTALENPNSVQQMKQWLSDNGIETDNLDKKAEE